jgi:hypothetical protein
MNEQTEEVAEEIIEDDQIQDEELESDDDIVLEDWQKEDDSVEEYQVDGNLHQSMKRKYKTRISNRDEELEKVKAENEALRLAQPKETPKTLTRPNRDDFTSDEEHQFAVSKYDGELSQETYNRNRLSETQLAEIQQAKQETDEAVESHYSRVDELIKDSGIKEENYKKADENFRHMFEEVIPNGGDAIADNIIERLGKGSEKVAYYLGVNNAARSKAKELFAKDKTGLTLAMYLGQQKQRLTKPIKPQSKAPDPTKGLNGDENSSITTIAESNMKKAYQKIGAGTTESYNIRKKGTAAGYDVSKW